MELHNGDRLDNSTFITSFYYCLQFRCDCGQVFTAGRSRVRRRLPNYRGKRKEGAIQCNGCQEKAVRGA